MQFDVNQKITFVGLIVAIIVGSGYYFYQHIASPAQNNEIKTISKGPASQEARAQVIVSISGAVINEGVYRIDHGKRTYNLIKLAGGALPSADYSSINLAEVVKDGQKILIPYKVYHDIVGSETKAVKNQENNKKININLASADELDSLPGVGPATAKQIIEARPFSKLEDISKIKRFGKNKFEKIKNRITL